LCFSSVGRLKETLQGRPFSFDTVGQGQGHSFAIIPAAALGILYEGRSIFGVPAVCLPQRTPPLVAADFTLLPRIVPQRGSLGHPKVIHNLVLLYDATLLATSRHIH
jgi:hypothetical protein